MQGRFRRRSVLQRAGEDQSPDTEMFDCSISEGCLRQAILVRPNMVVLRIE